MAAGHQHHHLLALAVEVSHRCGLAAGGDFHIPQHIAAVEIISAEIVVDGGCHKHHAAAGNHRAADAGHAHFNGQPQRVHIADGAVFALIVNLAVLQAGGGHKAPGRLLAGHADGREEGGEADAVGRAHVGIDAVLTGVDAAVFLNLALRNELRHKGQMQRHAEHHLLFRVDRNRAPVKHTEIAGIHNGAFQRGRGVAAGIIELVKFDAAKHLIHEARAPHFFLTQRLGVEAQTRHGLHGRSPIFGYGLGGAGSHLADGDNRFARGAVEHIHIALFGGHHQARLYAFGGGDVDQAGLGGRVHIP